MSCHVMFLVMSCCYLMTGGYRHERLLLLPCDVAAPPLRGAARPVRLHSGRGGGLPRQDVQTSGVQILVMNLHYLIANTVQIIAVAIETAIQNGGIAVVVLNLTFPR